MRRSGNALKTTLRLPNQKLSWSPNENEKRPRSAIGEWVAQLSAAYTMARALPISFRVKVISEIYILAQLWANGKSAHLNLLCCDRNPVVLIKQKRL